MSAPEQAAERTFLFADMAGFTALTEAMGDAEAVDIAEDFFSAAREALPEHGAVEVKTIGDAMMVEASHAEAAVLLGIRLARDVGVRHGFPSVRVGMHTGAALRRGEDWFGATVNLAARVSGAAAGGEVLLTRATREAAGEVDGIELVEHGRHELRNVAEPVELFRALPVGDERAANRLPIDPVCRMAVDPNDAAGTLRHEGERFYFCSMKCVKAFAEDPARYARAAGPETSGG